MKREYAEAYVKWADSDGFNLDFTSGDGVICGGFTAIFLIAAVSAQRFVFASILFVLLFGYCVLIAILKQKLQILTYFQKFLNIGASGLFTRVMFLLMSLTILEVTGMYGIWYYLLLIGAWLLINLSDFGFTWWRIRIGKFYALQEQVKERKKQKGKQGQKRRGGALALACVVGGLGGVGPAVCQSILCWNQSGVCSQFCSLAFPGSRFVSGDGKQRIMEGVLCEKV